MLCNSSKMTRIGFDVFLKIEKCQAFCRGRTCTVGKYKWFFGGSAGGRGIPAPSPGPGGFSAPQYPSLIVRFSAQNWPREKSGCLKTVGKGSGAKRAVWSAEGLVGLHGKFRGGTFEVGGIGRVFSAGCPESGPKTPLFHPMLRGARAGMHFAPAPHPL